MEDKKTLNAFWIFIAGAIGLLGLGIIKLFSSMNRYQGFILIGLGFVFLIFPILMKKRLKRK